jgi:integrase
MLTDVAIKRLTIPEGKSIYRVRDSQGLFFELVAGQSSRWRLRYSFGGREKLLSLGTYPEVGLKQAREGRDRARAMLADGKDPAEDRRAKKRAALQPKGRTFEEVALEWHEQRASTLADGHAARVLQLFERDVFPLMGSRPVGAISPPELLAVLRVIQARDAVDTAHRARGHCGQVFRYAIATGRAERDPSADLSGALPPVAGSHFAAQLDPDKLGEILLSIDAYQDRTGIVGPAMQLGPLVFVRPGELRAAKWEDLDLEAATLALTISKTKRIEDRRQLVVPLSTQAVAIVRGMVDVTKGRSPYVFPSFVSRDRPMSEAAVLAAYRKMGIGPTEMTGHGWRAVARTILDETLHFRVEIIEAELGHRVRDPNGRAYNRTSFLDDRRVMMQAWADYLDGLRAKAIERIGK